MHRRRKHWGWGFEDEQPAPAELRAAAAGLAAHLGFGASEPELPVALDAVKLPAPRLEAPFTRTPTSARCTRRARPTRTWCAASAAISPIRPTPWRARATRTSCATCSSGAGSGAWRWCRSAAATSVVGGIDALPGPGHEGVVAVNLSALDRVLEVDEVSRSARIQAGARGPRLEAQLAEHGLTLRFYPQSFELSTLGGWIATRAGGHFATGPTHIDDLVESVRAVTAGGELWESRRLPGLGRRAFAGPHAARLRGHARGDHRGVGARAAAARAAPLGERALRLFPRRARGRAGDPPERAAARPTAA